MIGYPKKLDRVFDKLIDKGIRPIIVGGYIRDAMLSINSKDVDVELYGISSYTQLQNILSEFGSVNIVGKSFGVCKLYYEDYDIDFSFPRRDNKTKSGHKGFEITVDTNMDFTQATSRRDFTINSMGYDVAEKKLLDPFFGEKDLREKILRAVDINSFAEDPLRVLRAVQFATRFELEIDEKLFTECKRTVSCGMLEELPKERIFEEIKKLLLWAKKPSRGFYLLNELKSGIYTNNGAVLDETAKLQITDKQTKLILMLAALYHDESVEKAQNLLLRFTNEKELLSKSIELIKLKNEIENIYAEGITDYKIYKLSAKTDIEILVLFCRALYLSKSLTNVYSAGDKILKRASELGVLHVAKEPLLRGGDILELGLKPSCVFSEILEQAYDSQLRGEFKDREEALAWLRKFLKDASA